MALKALYKVFRDPVYGALAFVVGAVAFVLAVWLPNIPLIVRVMGHPALSLSDKLKLPLTLLGGVTTNFSLFSLAITTGIAALFGVNLAMIVYYLKRRTALVEKSGLPAGKAGIATGFLGALGGILGTGCAACGSFVLTSGFSLIGAGGALALLPFGGAEFGILGVLLLVFSIYLTAKQIQNPAVCSS